MRPDRHSPSVRPGPHLLTAARYVTRFIALSAAVVASFAPQTAHAQTAPTLTVPADGAVLTSVDVTFASTGGTGVYGFAQVATDPALLQSPDYSNQGDFAFLYFGPPNEALTVTLENDATYFVRIGRGQSTGGGQLGWSAVRRFTVRDPNVARLVSPVQGAENVLSVGAQFVWTAVPGASGYRLEVGDGFSPPVATVSTSTPGATVTVPLGALQGRRWRVVTLLAASGEAASAYRRFTTGGPPPPVQTGPSAGAITASTAVTLAWTAAPGATFYDVELFDGTTATFEDRVANGVRRSPTTFDAVGLRAGTGHTWRVRATAVVFGQEAVGPWSPLRGFTTGATASPPISITAPVAGATLPLGGRIEFSPAPTGPDDVTQIQVATGAAFGPGTVVFDADTRFLPRAEPTTLPAGAALFVRARRTVGRDVGAWSSPVAFTSGAVEAALGPPVLSAPGDGAAVMPPGPGQNGVALSWSAVSGAARYHVQIARTDAFSVLTFTGTPSAASTVAPFTANDAFLWRVRAVSATGAGPWSGPRRFTTGGAPQFDGLTPASGSAGTVVTISGRSLPTSPGAVAVYFGSVPARVLTATATALTAEVPVGAETGPVRVVVGGAAAVVPGTFTVRFAGGAISAERFATARLPLASAPLASAAAADFDGDGIVDVAVLVPTLGRVRVLRGVRAGGTYALSPVALELTVPASATGLVAADLSGDGRRDLIAVGDADSVRVWTNASTGSLAFAPRRGLALPVLRPVVAVDVGDLDRNGRDDLVAAFGGPPGSTGRVLSMRTLTPGSTVLIETDVLDFPGQSASGVTSADFDSDGWPDVAAIAPSGGVAWARNQGINPPGSAAMAFGFPGTRTLSGGPAGVTTADFDGDGRIDLAIALRDAGEVAILPNTVGAPGRLGESAFGEAVRVPVGAAPTGVRALDVTGDGRPDLVLTTAAGLVVLPNRGGAGKSAPPDFGAPVPLTVAGGARALVAAGDLDGDGRLDLLVTSPSSAEATLLRGQAGVDVGDGAAVPGALALAGPAPNPARGVVWLRATVPAAGAVHATLYDALGRRAAVLFDGPAEAGALALRLDTGGMASGVYFVRLVAGGAARTATFVVAR